MGRQNARTTTRRAPRGRGPAPLWVLVIGIGLLVLAAGPLLPSPTATRSPSAGVTSSPAASAAPQGAPGDGPSDLFADEVLKP